MYYTHVGIDLLGLLYMNGLYHLLCMSYFVPYQSCCVMADVVEFGWDLPIPSRRAFRSLVTYSSLSLSKVCLLLTAQMVGSHGCHLGD